MRQAGPWLPASLGQEGDRARSNLSLQLPLRLQGASEGLCVEAQPLLGGGGSPQGYLVTGAGPELFPGETLISVPFLFWHFLGGLAWMGLGLGGDLDRVGDILLCAWGVLGLGKGLEQRGCGFESWCCETLDQMPPSLSLRCLIFESEQQCAWA